MRFILVLAVAGFITGCSGLELGGKLGVYAVDEKQDSSRTYHTPNRMSLKCLWSDCNSNVQGS